MARDRRRTRPRIGTAGRSLCTLLFVLAILSMSAPVALAADGDFEITPESVYGRLFTVQPMQEDWFAPEFLEEIPLFQMQVLVAQYVDMLGEFEGVDGEPPMFQLRFARGSAPSQLGVNEKGEIIGIWFGPPELEAGDVDEAVAGFHELPGDVSVFVASDAGVLAAVDADTPFAVGSAFKLAIAAALKDKVDAGVIAWDDVVHLEAEDISLPTGILQQWPPGTSLTVESLAALMISVSDNTATDALLRHVGRETVEGYAPRNKPLLTTREAFVLKGMEADDGMDADGAAALLQSYRDGDEAERRALLRELKNKPLPDAAGFLSEPTALDVEWFFTTQELAALIAHVHELPFMSINPGLASTADWRHVAFKGGSEAGVLNLTTFVTDDAGANYIVSATWNDAEALDESRFVALYGALLAALKQL